MTPEHLGFVHCKEARRAKWLYAGRMQTSMRLTTSNRDTLARIASDELGGVSLDEALRIVLFEHETRVALARLARDTEAAADYLREAAELSEVDVMVRE